jgi:hypothetical protein
LCTQNLLKLIQIWTLHPTSFFYQLWHKIYLKTEVIVMKPGASEYCFLCPECAKTHLREYTDQKSFFRLASARHEGKGIDKGKGVEWEMEGRRGNGKGEQRRR